MKQHTRRTKTAVWAMTVMLALLPSPSFADIIKGKVIDAETKEPLPGVTATAKILISDGQYSGSSILMYATSDSIGNFSVTSFWEGKVMLEFSLIGFYKARKVDYSFGAGSEDTVNVGTIELKPTALMLKEAQVNAAMPRFTVAGDTIVFHPEAFKLKEGVRLEELIQKLPGVEKREDGLYWNDKKLRLMVNGKDLFGGDGLTAQLPAEVAENIKLYNKRSEKAMHTGKDDGTDDNVLDIKVKPGFLDKWYGTIEGNYMTDKRYKGLAMFSYLSDDNPRMVYANMNNENRHMQRTSRFSFEGDIGNFGKSQYLSVPFSHRWRTVGVGDYSSNEWTINPIFDHYDSWADNYSTLQTFLPGEDRTWQQTADHRNTHNLSPELTASYFAYLNPKSWLQVIFSTSYKKQESNNETTQENYSNDPTGELISSQHLFNGTTTESGNIGLDVFWDNAPTKKITYGIESSFRYSDGSTRQRSTRELNYAREGVRNNLYQYFRTPMRRFSTTVTPNFSVWLADNLHLELSEKVSYEQKNTYREAFKEAASDASEYETPTSTDAANNMRNVGHNWGSDLTAQLMIKFTKDFDLSPSLTWKHLREQTTYAYGSLDTAAVRTSSFLLPQARLRWKIDRTRKFEISYAYNTSNPDLVSTFDYRDTTNPLYIQTGNALLDRSHDYSLNLSYVRLWPRKQTILTFKGGYQHTINPLTSLFAYNSETAAYTYMPANIRGGETTNVGLNYDQGIGFFVRFVNKLDVNFTRRYGYLTLTDITQTPSLNRQRITNLTNNTELSYETELVRVKAYNQLELNRYRYAASPTSNSTPLYMKYGADTRVKPGKFEFYVNFYDDFRSGYLVDAMNGHRWIVNAGILLKLCKNKLILSIDADDIFNRERTRSASYDAYQTSELWSQHLHHYVAFGIKFNFDAKEQKK